MSNAAGGSALEKSEIYEQLVDAFQQLFGAHPGYRPVHAKGIVCDGTFTPAVTAGSLSRAPHLGNGAVPITVRFSDFAGIPTIPDNDPNASPRGMAIRFHLPNDAATDIVAHSYNGFPVATAEEFLEFLRALAASGPDAPEPTPLETFLASHRRAAQYVQTPKPAPASFATESYYSVDAFRFTNRQGISRYGRYRIHPVAGEKHLNDKEAASRSPNYLFEELGERLNRGPVQFRVVAQLAGKGDPITDASAVWPEDRPQFELGVLSVKGRVADNEAAQRRIIFDPTRLVDGIEASEDPLIQARSEIYAISCRRRNA